MKKSNSPPEVKCKYCYQTINSKAKICHHCQQYQRRLLYFILTYLPTIIATIGAIITIIGAFISYLQFVDARKERIAAQMIKNETNKIATTTANLVAQMSSHTGWEVIPITQDRLNFYKTILEQSSSLIENSGDNPDDYKSIIELKGVIGAFKPNEEPISRPSSKELQSLAEEYDKKYSDKP